MRRISYEEIEKCMRIEIPGIYSTFNKKLFLKFIDSTALKSKSVCYVFLMKSV